MNRSRLFGALAVFGAGALALLGAIGHSNHVFGGDGYNYYSALRNFVDGRGMWEGPMYEHLLGNHSYLTLIILAPAVAIFRSHLVMVYASIACWLISVLLVYRITDVLRNRVAPGSSPWLPFLMASAYAVFPSSLQFALPWQAFQPDFMLTPALLALVLAMVEKNRAWLLGSIAFLAATKEEFVVLMPLFLAWAVLAYRSAVGPVWLTRRDWVAIAVTYATTAAIGATLLFHYRAMNQVGAAVVARLSFESLLLPWNLRAEPRYLWVLLFPFLPACGLIVWKGDRASRLFLAFAFLSFVIGREILNIAVYTRAVIPFFHTRIILGPTLIVAVAVGLIRLSRAPRLSALAVATLCVHIGLNIVGIRVAAIEPALLLNDLVRHPETLRDYVAQVDMIRPLIPAARHSADLIGLSPRLEPVFAPTRDHVIPVVFFGNYPRLKNEVQYTVFDKVLLTPEFVTAPNMANYRRFLEEYEVLLETRLFLVSRRKDR